MNSTQLPFVVEALLIAAAMVFGLLLTRAGRTHGKAKVAIHLFFVLWFAAGFAFIFTGLLTTNATGVVMLAAKRAGAVLPLIHLASAIVLFLSDAAAFLVSAGR